MVRGHYSSSDALPLPHEAIRRVRGSYVVDRRMPVAAGTEKRGIRAYPFPFVSNPTP
jgi:hypothetical protein